MEQQVLEIEDDVIKKLDANKIAYVATNSHPMFGG